MWKLETFIKEVLNFLPQNILVWDLVAAEGLPANVQIKQNKHNKKEHAILEEEWEKEN